jgi:competence protein ComEC
VVIKLVYKDVSLILCGDIQKEAMNRLLCLAPMLKSTVIKVPHHGSDEGREQDELFQAVSPRFAVISVEENSRYGFPAPEVVENLEQMGAQVYTTADTGAITLSTDGREVFLETMLENEGCFR